MTEKRYTVQEIDALRCACEDRWLFGTTLNKEKGRASRCYNEEGKTKCVEEIVRTHMLAGHIAQDIYDADKLSE